MNRSIPSAVVIPVLVYPDVREAVAWLSAAFGFVERLQIGESHRSQLSVGGGAVIVGEASGPRTHRGNPRSPAFVANAASRSCMTSLARLS